jgi:clan AA aspartic protease
MITGTISARRAYVPLRVLGPTGQEGEVEFMLDTGFTATATLPPTACVRLGLVTLRIQPVRLADGTRVLLDVYEATVMWDGVPRAIELLAKEGAPLIGMTLLDGSDVRLQVTEGGPVTIEPLRPPSAP